ncbi:serine kinase [Runella sp.]|uniref:serine kinase n=1 Tax=Runella sp. TaxID=1960881 RepID=UPI003D127CA6
MLFRAYTLTIDSAIDLQLPAAEGKADIVFEKAQFPKAKQFQTLIYRKGVRATFGGDAEEAILDWEGIARFKALGGNRLQYENLTDDEGVFRLFVLSEALGTVLFQRNLFLLHGSAVMTGAKATIFIGRPGAGKSTTVSAFAQQQHTILSDDLTVVWFDANGQPYVLPGFPELKIWESAVDNLGFDKSVLEPAFEGHNKFLYRQPEANFPIKPIPLEQIIILQRPYSSQVGSLKLTEAPVELFRHFPLPTRLLQGKYLQRHFEDSIRIKRAVPILKVPRPKNFLLLKKWIEQWPSAI